MHALQSKHYKLKPEEITKLLENYNISLSQLPKIKIDDVAAPENCNIGDVILVERKEKGKTNEYFRVVIA